MSWSQTTRVRADFQTSGLDRARFTPDVETTLYRIVQESLSNVAKHARASEVSIVLTNSGHTATLIVEDNGVGFDRTTIGFDRLGLLGMRERVALAGGELDVTSEPGQGTTVRARIPCKP